MAGAEPRLTPDAGSFGSAFELEFDGGAFGVAGFGDDHFGESGLGVLVVAVGAVQQLDGVGVLFEGAGVAEV